MSASKYTQSESRIKKVLKGVISAQDTSTQGKSPSSHSKTNSSC